MTFVLAITPDTNDMFKDQTNNIAIATGQTAIEQAAKTATLAQLQEMIFFTLNGMPALSQVFVGNPNYSLYSAAIVNAITAINGVVAVNSVEISTNSGILSYTATIETVYGETTING